MNPYELYPMFSITFKALPLIFWFWNCKEMPAFSVPLETWHSPLSMSQEQCPGLLC